jgi:hypothetical protein
MTKKQEADHAKNMFESIAVLIEETGKDDKDYNAKNKLLDIFDVLESLLAYTIFTACITPENVRDCAEESFVNIKKKALKMLNDHPVEDESMEKTKQ